MLGGAVGDALGAAVEFLSLAEIRAQFGPTGIQQFSAAYGRLGAVTDDTQMSMFTAEGLIRAGNRFATRGLCHAPTIVWHAYLRWLRTQTKQQALDAPQPYDGWFLALPDLWHRRAPGATCMSALQSEKMGSVEQPLNNSKGCGGIMRMAPVGLVVGGPERVFDFGCQMAASTHGHPSGFLSAGYLATVIAHLTAGQELSAAIENSLPYLTDRAGHEEVLAAIRQATRLAQDHPATPEVIESLGQGWVAEEALSISLYCALTAPDFRSGVIAAVNHGGDSDSTGAITGNILGTLCGVDAVPGDWLDALELRDAIDQLARDLAACPEHRLDFESDDVHHRYPAI